MKNLETTQTLILANNNNHLPEVGMGATIGGNGDYYPFTIHKVSKDFKNIWVSRDQYQAIPKKGGYQYGDNIPYTYTNTNQNDESQWVKYRLRKNGRYVADGAPMKSSWSTIRIGHRVFAQNPSF